MPARLTPRQEECLRLTRLMTDREIAARLGISEPTVKKHVIEACQRLGVNRRKAALAILEAAPATSATEPSMSPDAEPSTVSPSPVSPPTRFGYRAPPRDPVVKIAMIGLVTVVCGFLVGALTDMIAQQQRQVRSIELSIGTIDPDADPGATAS